MNNDLLELVKTYGTQSHNDACRLLCDKSKQNLISMLVDLTTHYFNDKNSSTLRVAYTIF